MFIKSISHCVYRSENMFEVKLVECIGNTTVYFDENRRTNTYILDKTKLGERDITLVHINTQTGSYKCILEDNDKLKQFFIEKGME